MTARTIKLEPLRRDLQVRAAIDAETVGRYAELMAEGAAFPPVVVFVDADGVFWLADGFHRAEAAASIGRDTIAADVREGDRAAALWFAMGANARRGLPMAAVDVRHAVRLALQAWPDKSQREIAQQVGCSLGLVNKVRQDVFTREHVSLPATRTDSIGRTQPTAKPKPPAPAPVAAVEAHPLFDAGDFAAVTQELEGLLRIVEADPKLAEAWRIITELRKELGAKEGQYVGAMADRNGLIRVNKSLQRRLRELSP